MGYENFIPLGCIRMKRNGYGVLEMESYRKKIIEEMVPAVCELKKVQQNRIGVDSMQYYVPLSRRQPHPLWLLR